VHSKIALVKKKKGIETPSYAILSTGNFNEITAQYYTDHVLMTTDPFIIKELLQLFKFLQKKDKSLEDNKLKFDKLMVSQFNLNDRLEKYINNEIEKVKMGQEGLIRIKVNNLEEPYFISLLSKASQAGVKINMIIRSVCCMMPGVPGLTENITIKRIVDRYLEHTRLFIFGEGDTAEVIMGSADLMNRNLYNRIEVCVSIKNTDCKKELLDYFGFQWADTDKAVTLMSNLDQKRMEDSAEPLVNAQQSIYSYLQNKS
jgi:polyphosphate kinase